MAAPAKTIAASHEWPEQGRWTYEDWARLPDDGTRYEVIGGVLHRTPPPNIPHQTVSGRLVFGMTAHVQRGELGWVFAAPVGVRLPNHPVPFQPDIVFVSAERKAIIGRQYIEGVPDLVVEIISPSNWPYDRQEKFRVYQMAGVPELWLVDYRAKTIEVFALEEGEYVLLGKWGLNDVAVSRALPGFQIGVAEVFRNL